MRKDNKCDAADYGFLPDKNGEENTAALCRAVSENSVVTVSTPGVYDMSGTVRLPSDTSIEFNPGTVVRRVKLKNPLLEGNLFINEGAFVGKFNENITVSGLKLLVNGVESAGAQEDCQNVIPGLRGHLAFLYIKNLIIENVSITGLCQKDYAVQISDFKNAEVRNSYFEGMKDGVHFGPGSGFAVRDCVFRTYDDAIALNCSDYSVSNPNFGTIENGIIENCTELSGYETEAFFIRILVGTARKWKKGMTVYHSDAVLTKNGMYRVVMHADNTAYVSVHEPDFAGGYKTIDGITWIKTHAAYAPDEIGELASCRNITVKNLTLHAKRRRGVYIYTAFDEYLRSYYRGSPVPAVENISFENVCLAAEFERFIAKNVPVDNLTLKNCFAPFGSPDALSVLDEKNPQLG